MGGWDQDVLVQNKNGNGKWAMPSSRGYLFQDGFLQLGLCIT